MNKQNSIHHQTLLKKQGLSQILHLSTLALGMIAEANNQLAGTQATWVTAV